MVEFLLENLLEFEFALGIEAVKQTEVVLFLGVVGCVTDVEKRLVWGCEEVAKREVGV